MRQNKILTVNERKEKKPNKLFPQTWPQNL